MGALPSASVYILRYLVRVRVRVRVRIRVRVQARARVRVRVRVRVILRYSTVTVPAALSTETTFACSGTNAPGAVCVTCTPG